MNPMRRRLGVHIFLFNTCVLITRKRNKYEIHDFVVSSASLLRHSISIPIESLNLVLFINLYLFELKFIALKLIFNGIPKNTNTHAHYM